MILLQKGFYKETVTGEYTNIWNVSILLSEKAYQIAYLFNLLSKFLLIRSLMSVCGHIYVRCVDYSIAIMLNPFGKKENVIIHCKFENYYNLFESFCFTGLYHWYLSNLNFLISTGDVLCELIVICCL